tara:strand:- start:3896 stop:4639 length:744 start_codon:yes stop_codon:yes gene_type:complete
VLLTTIDVINREKLVEAADVRGLLGLLISDGSLVPYRTPGGGYIQLTLTAGASESAFLEEKVKEFRQFINTKAQIVPYRTTPRANGKTTPILRFRVSTNKLRPVYNLLYPIGERQLTQTTLDLLGAQAAAWAWAEGAKLKKDGSAMLSRIGSVREEAYLFSQWLEMLSGASSVLSDDYVRPRLLFDPVQTRKIQDVLIKYAPKSRQHLFKGDQWDDCSISSARTELQLGKGQIGIERKKETSLVRNL